MQSQIIQPPASLAGTAATDAEAIVGTDTSKYLTPAAGSARSLYGDITRPVKPVLVSDGAPTGRRGEATFGTHAAGGLPMTFPWEIFVPESNPSSAAESGFTSSGSSAPGGVANGLSVPGLTATGELVIRQNGAGGSSDFRRRGYAGFRAAYAGRWVRGVFVLPGNSATGFLAYLPTGDATSLFTETTGGTPPNWLPAALDTTRFVTGRDWTSGSFVPHAPILGAWTEAEAMTWIRTGRLPLWCELGTGSAVKQTSGTLTIGRRYLIADAGGTFTGVGAANNDVGTVFTATGTAPTWGTGSVQPLGPLAKWVIQPPGVTCSDSGDNRVPLLLAPGITACGEKPEYVSVLSGIMSADGFVLADQVITPAGYDLVAAYVQRVSGSSTGTLTVRETSSGGTTVASGTLAAGTVALTLSNTLTAGGKKLHVANSSWSSSTVQLRFIFRRTLA